MRAFVIDDSKPVRSILTKMLQTMGFETTEAENGQQALERLSVHNKPDVFVVNWNMPVLNGLRFIQAVKAKREYADIPVLVVTAEAKPTARDEARNAGASHFIHKPVTLATLRKTLISIGVQPENKTLPAEHSSPAVSSSVKNGETKVALENQSKPIGEEATIRVLIVDDSVVVRGIVSKLLQEDEELTVVNTAADGVIALAKLKQCQADVILLDIEMPRMNGLEMLKELRKQRDRTPVVMFSSLTQRGASATIEALMLGAKDYVMKPGGAYMADAQAGKLAIMEELIPKVKQAAAKPRVIPPVKVKTPPLSAPKKFAQRNKIDAVVIGVSTGGPQALAKLIPKLGGDFPVPVIIVQHMPAAFTKHLSDRLTTDCGFNVAEAVHGQKLEASTFLVAPGGVHLGLKRFASTVMVALNDRPPVNACKPSADILFETAATAYSGNLLGVVLTGMGCDGTAGSNAIKHAGGNVIVQDEETSVVWGMPGSVVREGIADKVVPIDELASEILNRAWKYRNRNTISDTMNGEPTTP
ncbi:chemotaxis-specific protein-glutamate methyltransferase CheB [bacterium]|nr:chemotaxis-specific protein-glutamate methyltransferase CheB [bacterium]